MSKTGNYYNRIQVYLSDELASLFTKYCETQDLSSSKAAKKILSEFLLPKKNTTISESKFISRDKSGLQELQEQIEKLTLEIRQHTKRIELLEQKSHPLEDLKKDSVNTELEKNSVTNSVESEKNLNNDKSSVELVDKSDSNLVTELQTELATELKEEEQENREVKLINISKNKRENNQIELDSKSDSDKMIESLGYFKTNDTRKNNLLTNKEVLASYNLQGIEFDNITQKYLLKTRILWDLSYGKNYPFVIGGKKKTLRTDKLLMCRLYSSPGKAQSAKDRLDKKFDCDFQITHSLNLLNRLEPKDKLRLLNYWGKESLFKKQSTI